MYVVLRIPTTSRVDWTRLSILSSTTQPIFYQAGWNFWKAFAGSLADSIHMHDEAHFVSQTIFCIHHSIQNSAVDISHTFWSNQNLFFFYPIFILWLPWCDVKVRSSTWKSNGDSCSILKCHQCHTIVSPKRSNHASSFPCSQHTHLVPHPLHPHACIVTHVSTCIWIPPPPLHSPYWIMDCRIMQLPG